MITTFSVDTTNLGKDFLNQLKSLFPNKKIEIQVVEADATEYIKSSSENVKRLDRALERLEKMEGYIEVKPSDLERWDKFYLILKPLKITNNGSEKIQSLLLESEI